MVQRMTSNGKNIKHDNRRSMLRGQEFWYTWHRWPRHSCNFLSGKHFLTVLNFLVITKYS